MDGHIRPPYSQVQSLSCVAEGLIENMPLPGIILHLYVLSCHLLCVLRCIERNVLHIMSAFAPLMHILDLKRYVDTNGVLPIEQLPAMEIGALATKVMAIIARSPLKEMYVLLVCIQNFTSKCCVQSGSRALLVKLHPFLLRCL